jgi:C1A family cysteine protease
MASRWASVAPGSELLEREGKKEGCCCLWREHADIGRVHPFLHEAGLGRRLRIVMEPEDSVNPEHGFGWRRDEPDGRDHKYSPPTDVIEHLPPMVDLRRHLRPAYDQFHLNACTGNAIAAVIEFDELRQGMKPVARPSRMFIWYNERAMEGKETQNTGGQIRNGIKSVARQGVCPESLWPYKVEKYMVRPPKTCYSNARHYRAVEYQRMMHRLDELRGCLASGYPFVFGFKVYESFQGSRVKRTGVLNMPQPDEKSVGLHAVVACGYDDARRRFLVRNSWGRSWGREGYFTLKYEYLLDPELAHDFWTIRVVR